MRTEKCNGHTLPTRNLDFGSEEYEINEQVKYNISKATIRYKDNEYEINHAESLGKASLSWQILGCNCSLNGYN